MTTALIPALSTEPKALLIGQEKQLDITVTLNASYFAARKHALVIAGQLESMDGRCLNDQVLIMRARPEENYGAIYIPDTAREKTEFGIVVAVGDGYVTDEGKRIPLNIRKGDLVFFSKYYGSPRSIANMEFLQLREPEVEYALGGAIPDPA